MTDNRKTKRKLFNIFEKVKTCKTLNEETGSSDEKRSEFNHKLKARRRSTRLKSEIFVERILPDSLVNDPYDITKNEFEDTKFIYTPPKKKVAILKSSLMERIDKYFNIQPSNASNEQHSNIRSTALEVSENGENSIDETDSSNLKVKVNDDLHEYADSFLDSIDTNAIIDMLNDTEMFESQSQSQNKSEFYNVTTPNKNENLKPIVCLNSKEREISNKENNNDPKRRTKSNNSKNSQNVEEKFLDTTDTNCKIDSLKNSTIFEEKSAIRDNNSSFATNSIHYDSKSKEVVKPITSISAQERQVSSKENNNLQKKLTLSKTCQNIESFVDNIATKADVVSNSEIANDVHGIQSEDTNCIPVSKKHNSLNSKSKIVSFKENNLQKKSSRSKISKKNRSDIEISVDAIKTSGTKEVLNNSGIIVTSQEQNEFIDYFTTRNKSETKAKKTHRTIVSSNATDQNISCKTNNYSKKNENNVKSSTKQSLKTRIRKDRHSACPVEKYHSLDSKCSNALNASNISDVQFQKCLKTENSTSLTSPPKTVENEKSLSLRKRTRRLTVSSIQMDNNVSEVMGTDDSGILPRIRRRRNTICQTKPESKSNCDEKKTIESSSGYKTDITVINEHTKNKDARETSDRPRNRLRRLTVSNMQRDNIGEVMGTDDSGMLPRITRRRRTICQTKPESNSSCDGKKNTESSSKFKTDITNMSTDNKLSKVITKKISKHTENKGVNETSDPPRSRVKRLTVNNVQMDNNVGEVIGTNDSCQLQKAKRRKLTICQTELESISNCNENKTLKSISEKYCRNIDATINIASNKENTHTHIKKLLTGSQMKDLSEQLQKEKNLNPEEKEVINEPKRKRGRPRSSTSPKNTVHKKRIQKINIAKKPKNTCGRLSKDKLNSVNIRKIPKDRLEEVLDMLQNEDHLIWKDRNISCNAGIHRYWENRPMVSDQNIKMKYARQFLLRRDWLNLAKILCLSNQDPKSNIYYPLLVKVNTSMSSQ